MRKGRGQGRSSNLHITNKRNLHVFCSDNSSFIILFPMGRSSGSLETILLHKSLLLQNPPASTKSQKTVLEGTLGVLYPSLSLKADSAVLTIADKLPSILFTKKVTSSGYSIVSFSVSPTVSYVFTYRVLGKSLLIKSQTLLHHPKPNYFLPYP